MFFIDHNAKSTSFIDPRLPNELPLLQNETSGAMTLMPPPPPRHHGASLTPPPSSRTATPNHLAPPVDPVNRRRSRSVGDEDMHFVHSVNPTLAPPDSPTLGYNERVVAFLRQSNILSLLKEKNPGLSKHLKEKIHSIRQDGIPSLNKYSHDVELTLILRYKINFTVLKLYLF